MPVASLCGRPAAGSSPGVTIGKTDELGMNVVEDPVHVNDLQATILHCLGFDHTRLTYRHMGRDFRLTDVRVKSSVRFSAKKIPGLIQSSPALSK